MSQDGVRQRTRQIHHDISVESLGLRNEHTNNSDPVFEDEEPSSWDKMYDFACDFIFYASLAVLAWNVFLVLGHWLGFSSHSEWNPTRWWLSDAHSFQQELFRNAVESSATTAQFELLKTWIEGHGGWVSPKLIVSDYLSEKGRYDRRLEVHDPVNASEELVRLPFSLILSTTSCKQQALRYDIIRQVVEAQQQNPEVELSSWTWIAFCLVVQSQTANENGSTSNWSFNSLFRDGYVDATLSYMPVFWEDDTLEWLNGTDVRNLYLLDLHAIIETEYEKLNYLVSSVKNKFEIIDFKKWAMVVLSRGITLELSDPANATTMMPQFVLLPLIDSVEHSLPVPEDPLSIDDLDEYREQNTRVNVSYSTELELVTLHALQLLPSNAAVTMARGTRSSSENLLYGGFTMSRAWSDAMLCTFYTVIQLPLPENFPSWKSGFLSETYSFYVPSCPTKEASPHVIVEAARFLLATEEDVINFAEQKDFPEGTVRAKDRKFLHHAAKEAVMIACDVVATPPVCKVPLSVENEIAVWDLIKKETLARVASHISTVEEDDLILNIDDKENGLTINQRHAVIARREEKLSLRWWCAVVVRTVDFLLTPEGVEECVTVQIPGEEFVEGGAPLVQPMYWSRVLKRFGATDVPTECTLR